jgi:hypothetical protein
MIHYLLLLTTTVQDAGRYCQVFSMVLLVLLLLSSCDSFVVHNFTSADLQAGLRPGQSCTVVFSTCVQNLHDQRRSFTVNQ